MRNTLNMSILIFLGGIFKRRGYLHRGKILLGRLDRVTMDKGERNIGITNPVNPRL